MNELDDMGSIVDSLRETALPLRHREPCEDETDLRLLPFVGARIVGLGESNHGSREFFEVKDRLLRFLVRELGFTAFAIEAPYATGRAVDDYVRFGRGDLADVLTGLRYMAWDNQELANLLTWMREFNDGVPAERKVRFWGLDLYFSGAGASFVRSFLDRVAPERTALVAPVLDILVESDRQFPNSRDQVDKDGLRAGLSVLDELIEFMRADRERLAAKSSLADCDSAVMLLTVMRQWSERDDVSRSRQMGENLLQLLDVAGGDTRAVVWAHNAHIRRSSETGGEASAGRVIAERYGDAYAAWMLECGRGSFQTRSILESGQLGSLGVTHVAEAPVGTVPWCLEATGLGDFAVDLHRSAVNSDVARWLSTSQRHRDASWADEDPSEAYSAAHLSEAFDGIVFIGDVSPAHPTLNAQLNAAGDRGL